MSFFVWELFSYQQQLWALCSVTRCTASSVICFPDKDYPPPSVANNANWLQLDSGHLLWVVFKQYSTLISPAPRTNKLIANLHCDLSSHCVTGLPIKPTVFRGNIVIKGTVQIQKRRKIQILQIWGGRGEGFVCLFDFLVFAVYVGPNLSNWTLRDSQAFLILFPLFLPPAED